MCKVLVLLSTYNGEKYLQEQIDSILNQEGVDIELLTRDDCSSDKSLEILNKNNINYYQGENLGPARSFLNLLKKAPQCDYYAFSDQDDIWDKDKLYSAVKMLSETGSNVYCGSLRAYNEINNSNSVIHTTRYSDLECMFRNAVAGCSMVFDNKVRDRVLEYNPNWIEMHDSWIVRICTYCKDIRIVFDRTPHMMYRLHGDNVMGTAVGNRERVNHHLNNLIIYNKSYISLTAHELLQGYKKYMDSRSVRYLMLLDKSQKIEHRLGKILSIIAKNDFSSTRRKINYMFYFLFKNA